MEGFVRPRGFTVVRDFVGHGIGRHLHEEPQIPNYRPHYKLPRLKKGMALAIEPMVNAGRPSVKILDDGWTVVTADGKPSAHFEHTVIVTDGAPLIVTVPANSIFLLPSSAFAITLAATGAQEPFSTNAIFLFWKFRSVR